MNKNTGQSEPIRYLLSALIFPVGVAWLSTCFAVSKLFPQKYHWNGSKVTSCIGAFLQVGFSTMSTTSLAPMMCYKHPNGLRSILKYPGVLCGSADHDMMLVIGWILLTVFVLGFVALCTYAVSMDARRQQKLERRWGAFVTSYKWGEISRICRVRIPVTRKKSLFLCPFYLIQLLMCGLVFVQVAPRPSA